MGEGRGIWRTEMPSGNANDTRHDREEDLLCHRCQSFFLSLNPQCPQVFLRHKECVKACIRKAQDHAWHPAAASCATAIGRRRRHCVPCVSQPHCGGSMAAGGRRRRHGGPFVRRGSTLRVQLVCLCVEWRGERVWLRCWWSEVLDGSSRLLAGSDA